MSSVLVFFVLCTSTSVILLSCTRMEVRRYEYLLAKPEERGQRSEHLEWLRAGSGASFVTRCTRTSDGKEMWAHRKGDSATNTHTDQTKSSAPGFENTYA